jgi:hypothetical protein
VGIYPGQPERYFVLDFTLGEHFTDEVLVASADEDGVVDDEIVWESCRPLKERLKERRRPSPLR